MCSAHFIAIPSHFKDINLLIDSFHQRFSEHFVINFRFRILFVYKTRQFFLSTQSSKLPYKPPKTCMSFEKKRSMWMIINYVCQRHDYKIQTKRLIAFFGVVSIVISRWLVLWTFGQKWLLPCVTQSILHFIVNNLLGANDITTHRKISEYSSVLWASNSEQEATFSMQWLQMKKKWNINGL